MAKIYFVYFDVHTGFYPGFNHGLAYLIGALKNSGNAVSLSHIKHESEYREALEKLYKEKPDLVGLSFTSNQKKYARDYLNKLKLDHGLVIAGGTHCIIKKDEIWREFPDLDGICIGEGEAAVKELCRRIDSKENYLYTSGFSFKSEDGIIKNPRIPLEDMDSLSLPDYSLFDYNRIIEDGGFFFPMMISRGCPYDCWYCCNHVLRNIYADSKYMRLASVSRAIKIIRSNLALYPRVKKIVFVDDTFTFDKKWLLNFCEIYKREIDLPFICNARVENIDENIALALKESGCASIQFGIESGNEWVRTYILNRKHSNETIKNAFAMVRKHRIKTFSFNMLGLPFETKKMAMDTLNLNFQLRTNFGNSYYFYPYPGTRLYDLCAEYGLLVDDLESVSGYFEAPSLREVFISHKEVKDLYKKMKLFFYSRLLFSKIKIPFLLELLLLRIVFIFKGFLFPLVDSTTKNRFISGLRLLLRRFALRFLR